QKIQGRVVCQFDVNIDGTISNIQIAQGLHPSLDSEAVRVIQSMPRWMPGKRKGKPVKVRFTLPINFSLQ
ncbi:MAG TPA: energy transducer TonB, partial [Paludibacteraceae bacterium]|nr:energy transducer TonB [Paludibacteraceae bacterium]